VWTQDSCSCLPKTKLVNIPACRGGGRRCEPPLLAVGLLTAAGCGGRESQLLLLLSLSLFLFVFFETGFLCIALAVLELTL
jgi:hypothetical protein